MNENCTPPPYFEHIIQINRLCWDTLELGAISSLVLEKGIPQIVMYRHIATHLSARHPAKYPQVSAAQLQLYASLLTVSRYLVDILVKQDPNLLTDAVATATGHLSKESLPIKEKFVQHFPPCQPDKPEKLELWLKSSPDKTEIVMCELLLLQISKENRALDPFRELFDDAPLRVGNRNYEITMGKFKNALKGSKKLPEIDMSLIDALLAPLRAEPLSLAGQLQFIKNEWSSFLPPKLLEYVDIAFDALNEELRERSFSGEPPLPPVMEFNHRNNGSKGSFGGVNGGDSVFGGYDYPEHEAFSTDAEWMPNVVLLAKMVYVWLDQLSRQYGYPITRLDQIPDAELKTVAGRGFTALWLIGVWERSPASQKIKEICGNPDAIASAYSLYDYEIAPDLGGWEALANLRKRALIHGIRLASDMVPNHTGIYSRWVRHHPDWFIQTDYPPFPTYQFNGENLSLTDDAVIQIEDGYWTKSDAAVVFRMIERSTGRTRYIYHGNDGTTIPWNDTAQLNYLLPEVREAVIQTILHVARNFPIIRFDAAMTLAKKHYQRLWFPIRGVGGGIPSRSDHGMTRGEFDALFPTEFWRETVDRIALEAPGTLLLAEAFWLMEGYFVRTLGMHRVYNSAFMNMLMKEENAKYRQTIKNVLAFNPEVLQRFVNFMNNPDEKTAAEQFGSEGKYFGSCLLLATMPGLPMFGHGQVEGFHEKYGMEYKRAYWDEPVDQGLLQGHEMWIFPILRKRRLFSGATNFAMFDFTTEIGVDENVFAYSNRYAEECALVIYNNSYTKTAGWISESSPIAKGGGDNPETAITKLSEALGVSAEKGVYYAFHDHTRNLDYLRSGEDLALKGLYAELGEYEFHIFTDFRELKSSPDEPWGELCSLLNGQGVQNLSYAMKEYLFPQINSSFSELLLLAKERTVSWEPFSTVGGGHLSETFATTDGIRIVLATLVLKGLGGNRVEKFGLDFSLEKLMTKNMSYRAWSLVYTLCNAHPYNFETIFATDEACRYLQVHTSAGVEWFNKERFEEFLLFATIIKTIIAGHKLNESKIKKIIQEVNKTFKVAADAGYRTELFKTLLPKALSKK